jgi:hypothetical protein
MGIQAATLQEIKEIRKGILLAQHDHMVEAFRQKHENEPYEFVHDWLEIQEQTEKLITGGAVLSGLTMKAYWRTMDTLKGED